jgi:chromosomal replication initiation ATPase DnaA
VSRAEQLALDFEHRSASGMADFLVAESNAEAVGWIDRWPEWPGPALALHGPAGSGKSHLACVFREKSGAGIADAKTVIAGPGAADAWVIDGVAAVLAEAGEEALLHFYNTLVERRGSLLLVERDPPAHWHIKLADLRSRLNAAGAVGIGAPGDELLAAVLMKLFADRQLRVGKAVIYYALTRMERSFAAAGELVERLDRSALAERREITVPLARRVLDAAGPDGEGGT